MLRKDEFTRTHPEVRTGMTAFSAEGERIGVIERLDDDGITIEKGRIFHNDVHVPYDDIEDIRAEDVIIRQGRSEFAEAREEQIEPLETSEYGAAAGLREPGREWETEEVRIPLREEKLEARKREKEGEVRIHKDVYTETQRIDVPLRKEEVHVEHVPASERDMDVTDERAFEEQEVRIPIREEVVEVTKRPVVKEEIRVAKETRTEEEPVSGEVRKEKVKVERDEPREKK